MVMKIGIALRSLGWAVIWVSMHPEMSSLEVWANETTYLVGVMALYFVSWAIMEVSYRLLVWKGLFPRKHVSVATAPECPQNPWFSVLEKKPVPGVNIEVFCGDGNTRKASTIDRENGLVGILVTLTKEEAANYAERMMELRPTHWRFKSAENGEDKEV